MDKIVKISPEINPEEQERAESLHKEWLYEQHWVQKKSLAEIGRLIELSASGVRKRMKKYDVPRHSSKFTKGHTTNVGRKFTAEQIRVRYVGENNPRWKGGKKNYYKHQARRIWSEYYNYPIPQGLLIHHRDENYRNNNIENLVLLTPSFHQQIHKRRKRECQG